MDEPIPKGLSEVETIPTTKESIIQSINGIIDTNPETHTAQELDGALNALKEAGLDAVDDVNPGEFLDIFIDIFSEINGYADIPDSKIAQTHLETVRMLISREEEATRDPLTGLLNRRAFNSRSEAIIEKSQNNHNPVVLFMLDMGKFKQVNDTYGHLAGDEVLTRASRRLTNNTRPQDILARFGGDEFVILIEGLTPKQIQEMATRLSQEMVKPYNIRSGETVNSPMSFGVAVHKPGESMQELIERADVALYQAKKDGGSGFEIADNSIDQIAKDNDSEPDKTE